MDEHARIQLLIELTGGCSEDEAQKLLWLCNQNVEQAANRYFDKLHGQTSQAASDHHKPSSRDHQQAPSSSTKKRKHPAQSDSKQKSIASFFSSPSKQGTESKPPLLAKAIQQPSPIVIDDDDAPGPSSRAKPIETAVSKTKKAATDTAAKKDAVLASLEEYDPIIDAPWQEGQPMPYLHIARCLAACDSTTKRLRISDALVNTFRSILALSTSTNDHQELVAATHLLLGQVGPKFEGVVLGVGGSTVSGVVCDVTAVSKARLSQLYHDTGDLGDAAEACKSTQSVLMAPAPLTVAKVLSSLRSLSLEKGQGSTQRKRATIASLLRACRESETKYLVRTLIQALRVGASETSVIPALARAVKIHKNNNIIPPKAELDTLATLASEAYQTCPDVQRYISALLAHPVEEITTHLGMTPGLPVKPMLGKIVESIPAALAMLKEAPFIAEYKYDGVRAQIHLLDDDSGFVYSRNSENQTAAYQDVLEIVKSAIDPDTVRSLVIDAEVVAVRRTVVDEDSGVVTVEMRSFQELMTRGKSGTNSNGIDIAVYVFDILQLNGESLLQLGFQERRAKLQQVIGESQVPGRIQIAQGILFSNGTSSSKEEESSKETRLKEYLIQAFTTGGCEGLMLKSLTAKYEPSKRSEHWIKLKRDYIEEHRDTLDLVVIGAWKGNGRKHNWYSPFLLACYNPDTEELESVCRVMSGFSDSFYKAATERLSETIIPAPRPYYQTTERCDVWFEPNEVWEIGFADITVSTVHRAAIGKVHADRGVSVRFPRFLRMRNEDKSIEDATSSDAIAELYHQQSRKVS